MRRPSIQVGLQPCQLSDPLPARSLAPSASLRGTASTSAMVISAVSSVSTLGVLVTVMPLRAAASTSTLSMPLEKLAISFRFGPAFSISAASIVSVSVGTSTSARAMASASFSRENGRSSWFSSTLNSSPMRASTEAGSLRVTTTTGFLGLFIG